MINTDNIKLCECGCGNPAPIATQTNNAIGHIKGIPTRFIRGHQSKFTKYRHGHAATKNRAASLTYVVWASMKARCTNTNHRAWKNYGGRGIIVCARWQSFQNFLIDMGEKPDNRSLDRKNNNGNYEPKNCRWATLMEQQLNKRTVKLTEINVRKIKYQLQTDAPVSISKQFNVSPSTIWDIRHCKTWKHL